MNDVSRVLMRAAELIDAGFSPFWPTMEHEDRRVMCDALHPAASAFDAYGAIERAAGGDVALVIAAYEAADKGCPDQFQLSLWSTSGHDERNYVSKRSASEISALFRACAKRAMRGAA